MNLANINAILCYVLRWHWFIGTSSCNGMLYAYCRIKRFHACAVLNHITVMGLMHSINTISYSCFMPTINVSSV